MTTETDPEIIWNEIPSRRRSEETNGYVNWPINDPKYVNSREGGMFVYLVVVEDTGRPLSESWMRCCGGYFCVDYNEVLVGDDAHLTTQEAHRYHFPEFYSSHLTFEEQMESARKHAETGVFEPQPENGYRSTAYLAVINLGSTGWSGWRIGDDGEKYGPGCGYFVCKFEHLTPDGKALYNSIQKLYPGCQLYIQTWLDT